MEIIFRGSHPDEERCKGTCTRCKTQVKYKKKEAHLVSDQRDGDYYTVSCPICSNMIYGTSAEYVMWLKAENAKTDPY